jgi:hypothetical protein
MNGLSECAKRVPRNQLTSSSSVRNATYKILNAPHMTENAL